MLKIIKFTCENTCDCITDSKAPRFSFTVESDKNGAFVKKAEILVNGEVLDATEQILVEYKGAPLKPFTRYGAKLSVTANDGDTAESELYFTTGRMGAAWEAEWITDGDYKFTEKKVSPTPMTFKKEIKLNKKPVKAVIYSTAIGIYELELNGKRVGERYFAPGFTSYKTTLQYQTYDVTDGIGENNVLYATVAGGWAVGAFVFTRKNRVTADRQALLLELRLTFEDGSTQIIGTDCSWLVSREGKLKMADLYDGETWDERVDLNNIAWRNAQLEKVKIKPEIIAEIGAPVTAHEELKPVSCVKRDDGELIYDFGQNFAGVIKAKINGKNGDTVIFRHAEILKKDGSLFTELLRTAKATATYTCVDGEQVYSPKYTYMGFRYVGVKGVNEGDIELSALALYSDMERTGDFACSDERINKLQSNITWSAKSNFMDIPTDCPQRDERMGWTGDIALFAPTACYNFDMSRFLEKWLRDVKNEQLKTGGIPNTVPVQGYGFPATMPEMAIDFWGDACLLVPYAEYMARGDKKLLERYYPMMKKYVNACKFWANLLSFGKRRYIWHTPSMFHFGDWVAPDEPTMVGWQKRSKYTATASLCHTSGLLSRIAGILGYKEDEEEYKELSNKVADAYVSVFTDGNGKMNEEFQTAYVLPLAYNMFPDEVKDKAADNFARLVRNNDYKIGTGFPGTPYILFALFENGKKEEAFKMLTCDRCPSWLYEVKAGGTSIWERWDALGEDGHSNLGENDGTGGMVSFNHYASGAVGEFLYRKVAGIEPVECGYKKFKIEPSFGEGIASANASLMSPYGKISSKWAIEDNKFNLEVEVPCSAECTVILPNGERKIVNSGKYAFECEL